MKRLSTEAQKSLANLLLNTSIKRILEKKKQKDTCDECKQSIYTYIKSTSSELY